MERLKSISFSLFRPDRFLILGYIVIIGVGALILLLPPMHNGDLSFTDAMFTSTSAVCVTGLIVKDTPHDFTIWGIFFLLFLIQIGGVGYMMFTSFMIMMIGKPLRIRDQFIIKEQMNVMTMDNLISFVKKVLIITFVFESIGAVILFFRFLSYFNWQTALLHAVFHSISAFCNAGFSTFSDSLTRFASDWIINLVVMTEIVIGGIGFIVIIDMENYIRKKTKMLMEHSLMVLTFSLFLIIIGAVLFMLMEWDTMLSYDSGLGKYFIPLFQSITARTAGFNTIPLTSLRTSTLFLLVLLMFIGASPGGTGGGIKTTTFFLLLLNALSYLRGKEMVVFNYRTISRDNIERALNLFFFVILVIAIFMLLLIWADPNIDFTDLFFEVFSAIGTVGLSLGSKIHAGCSLSADFTCSGKWIIIFLMLIGRAGIITFLTTLFMRRKVVKYRYPEVRIVVG